MPAKKNRFYFILLISLFNTVQSYSQNLDVNTLQEINENTSGFKNQLAGITSSSITPVTIGVPVTLFVAGLIKKSSQLKRDAFYISASYIFSGICAQVLKNAFKERRPFDKYSYEIVKRNTSAGGGSFPSGHTSSAFNIATSLSLRYRKAYVIIPAYVYASTMAWARMYQGVHYPSDVLAGAAVGAASAWVTYKLQRLIEHKKRKQ